MRVAKYKLLHGAFIKKLHFFPLSETPMAIMTEAKSSLVFFITGVRCDFHASLWDLSQNSLLKCLEIVL